METRLLFTDALARTSIKAGESSYVFSNSPTNSVPKGFCDFNHISIEGARASFDYRKIVLCGGVIMSEGACEPTVGKRKTQRVVAPPGNWIERLGLSLVLLLLVAVFSAVPVVRDSELRVSDTFFRLAALPANRSTVVLVSIDDESLRQYGRWPWSREVLSELVSKVAGGGAGAIGLDILLSERQSPEADASLEQSIRATQRVVIVDKIGAFQTGNQWVEPLPEFVHAANAVGHAHAVLDEDGICRRFPPVEMTIDGPRWAFAVEVARQIDPHRTAASGSTQHTSRVILTVQ